MVQGSVKAASFEWALGASALLREGVFCVFAS